MHRTLLRALLLGVAMASTTVPASAQTGPEDLVGSWHGQLTPQLRLVFHIELADDGSLAGTIDSPDQGAFGTPLSSVTLEGDAVTLGVAAFGASFSGTYADGRITGTFSQGGANLPLTLTPAEGEPERPARPQDPQPPLPYLVEDVTFTNEEAGIELAGTITRPDGGGPFPGVVLVSGSGPQDRDESLLNHRPFLVLADHLTRNGIAVLRFDDRGVGASGGDFESATSADFASDALAAVSHLRARRYVDDRSVGIAGHSEGGLIAPMAANRSDAVAFVVMLAGPALPGIEILVAQGRLIAEGSGASPELVELNARIQQGLADIVGEEPDPDLAAERMRAFMRGEIETLAPEVRTAARAQLGDEAIESTVRQMNSPWFRFFLHHDPRPDLARLRVPVLALTGAKDLQVPPTLNEPELEAALARSPGGDATVRTLPGLNHLFQEAQTGLPAEYGSIEQTMSPSMLEIVSEWIVERFGPGR